MVGVLNFGYFLMAGGVEGGGGQQPRPETQRGPARTADEERAALEQGSRHGPSHAFRTRCRMILLKADRLPSAQVAEQIGCCMIAVNGWVKRGPVGLIGHTKGDAIETVGSLLEDLPTLTPAPEPTPEAVTEFLEQRGVRFTTWDGWHRLDAHERALGEPHDRARIKVVDRETMIEVSRGR